MKVRTAAELALAICITELAGVVGSLFTAPAIAGWYATLAKPALTPPGWVFGPVWSVLYALMGVAAYFVWREGSARGDVRTALSVFALQLVLNVLWSVIFFGLARPDIALAEIALLWVSIVWTMVLFYRIRRRAAYLLAPYLLWVSFAAYLNYAIWYLN